MNCNDNVQLTQIANEYSFKISCQKTKTMAFKSKYPMRNKIILDNNTLEELRIF